MKYLSHFIYNRSKFINKNRGYSIIPALLIPALLLIFMISPKLGINEAHSKELYILVANPYAPYIIYNKLYKPKSNFVKEVH